MTDHHLGDDDPLASESADATPSERWVPATVASVGAGEHTVVANGATWLPVGPTARRAGRTMQTIAVFGVVVAVVAGIVTWNFLGELERNVDRSLVIGAEAAVTPSDTIDVADSLVATLDDGLVSISTMTETIAGAIANVADVSDAASELATTMPTTLADIDAALVTVENLGGTVDSTLSALASLPFGPNYNPEVPFPEAIGNLRNALDPLSAQLTTIGDELGEFSASSGSLSTEVNAFLANIESGRDALAGTQVLLDSYRIAADDARDLAISSRTDLDVSITWTRLVVVLLALLIAFGQYIPWWLGSHLVEASDPSGAVGDSDDEPAQGDR